MPPPRAGVNSRALLNNDDIARLRGLYRGRAQVAWCANGGGGICGLHELERDDTAGNAARGRALVQTAHAAFEAELVHRVGHRAAVESVQAGDGI